jgi:hypothetical protein
MPYDNIEKLPTDNSEVLENEKIILNNLYPEENNVKVEIPSDKISEKEFISLLPEKEEKDIDHVDIIIPPENKPSNSMSYIKIILIISIFIILNVPFINDYITSVSQKYNVYIKIFLFSLTLFLLNFFHFL